MQDSPFELEDWIAEQSENQWAIRTVKMWFTLHSQLNKNECAAFPQILDDKAFFEKAIDILRSEITSINEYI